MNYQERFNPYEMGLSTILLIFFEKKYDYIKCYCSIMKIIGLLCEKSHVLLNYHGFFVCCLLV